MKLDHDKLKTHINQTGRIIVQRIVRDLEERRGLGDAWLQIDSEIQKEIRAEWREIATTALARFGLEITQLILDPIADEVGRENEAARDEGDHEAPGVGGPPDAEGL